MWSMIHRYGTRMLFYLTKIYQARREDNVGMYFAKENQYTDAGKSKRGLCVSIRIGCIHARYFLETAV